MTATIHPLRHSSSMEHLSPAFIWPNLGGPISDARVDIDSMLDDIRQAWDWAIANHLAVLSVNADRCGAYICIAAVPKLYTVFGDECSWVQRKDEGCLRTELWIGCIGHIRVFWREVKCVH